MLPILKTQLQPSLKTNFTKTLLRCLSSQTQDIKKVVVIGAGLMGSGIVQVSSQSGYKVVMVDQSSDALKKGEGIIRGSLARVAKKKYTEESEQKAFIEKVSTNYSVSNDLTSSLKDSDLVIEAIVENLEVKQKLFKLLDENSPQNTIFCSNTSSLPINQISQLVNRKDRFAGLHFFNPVPQMKLVEVISGENTSKEVIQNLTNYCKAIGKTPIQCKDTPGFIVNRLLVPYMLEAVRLHERGDATIEDIDIGMKLGAGYPMGPFELMDYVGLDTLQFITKQWYDSNPHLQGDKLITPSETIQKLVSEGNLGRKSGKGFYDYSKK
ncbi:hydroxyacyl-coenzyme A dehydrogenase [Neoconidiobolus thromboides FSU 785]|nr:hydroxyacyl-coenzyme A dehydrogenase [Neoconidiobolus thromboides FSU 785]